MPGTRRGESILKSLALHVCPCYPHRQGADPTNPHNVMRTFSLTLLCCLLSCHRFPIRGDDPPRPNDAASAVLASPPPPPSTGPSRATIACGSARCNVGDDFCYVQERTNTARCLPLADETLYGNMDDLILHCDDTTDCSEGQLCCGGSFTGTGPTYQRCSKNRCPSYEACVPGALCSAGLTCAPSRADPRRGQCVPEKSATSCGPKRCAASQPACCWNRDLDAGRCTAPSTPDGGPVCFDNADELRQCANRSDCGGYFCCLELLGRTSCSSSCPGASIGVACTTKSDCPSVGPGPGGIPQRYSRCLVGPHGWGVCDGDQCGSEGKWRPCSELQ
jgi:hypothetical protein